MRPILLAVLVFAQMVPDNRALSVQESGVHQKVAPAFKLRNLKGQTSKLSDYKGKVVLVNLWATWCAPCLVEIPELVKLQRENKSRGLQILGVTFPDDTRASVRRMSQKFKLNYPVLLGDNEMLEAYEIGDILPTTVVIDREGKIRDRILGILEPKDFIEKIAPLLESTHVP